MKGSTVWAHSQMVALTGTSLVSQWLRLCAFSASTAGGEGLIPDLGTKIPHTLWPGSAGMFYLPLIRWIDWFLKEITSEYSLKRPTLKLKLQYFGHLMQMGKDPDAGKD